MDYEEQKAWIKKNKKNLIENLIEQSGAITDEKPSAIFMTGLPGAGKTELTKILSIQPT